MERLEQTLRDILAASKLSLQDVTDREQIMQKLRGVVAQSLYLRGASVVPHGSFASQLSTRWGDLDISMDIPNSNAANALENLKTLLWEKVEEWQNVVYIPSSRVPILKFDHATVSCDVSVNNWSSQLKSKLLLLISKMDPRFHDMILLVKEWAQNKNINDAVKKTFNSYCLTLLVVYHFQTCDPPILPPLENICSTDVVDIVREGVSKNDAMKQIIQKCDKNIAIWRTNTNRFRRPVNDSSLSELLISFMDKFSDLSNFEIDRICTSTGKRIRLQPSDPIAKLYHIYQESRPAALIVLDPFEKRYNVAKTVWKSSLPKIAEAFKSTHDLLTTRQLSRNELLVELSKNVRLYTVVSWESNNKSQQIPQHPGLLGESIDCTDTKREIMYSDEEAETYSRTSSQSKLSMKSLHPVTSSQFINKSQWIPQQPCLRESTSQSTYPARLNYGSKDTRRDIMYSEEEAETSSQKSSWSLLGGFAMMGVAALAGTALYSMSRDHSTTKHDSDTDEREEKHKRGY